MGEGIKPIITHPIFGTPKNPPLYAEIKTIMTHPNFWCVDEPFYKSVGLFRLIPNILHNSNNFRVLRDGVETKNTVFDTSDIDRVYHIHRFSDEWEKTDLYYLLGRIEPEKGKFSYITIEAKSKNSFKHIYDDTIEEFPIDYNGTIEIITTDVAKRLPIERIPSMYFDTFNLLKKDGVDVMDRIKCCRAHLCKLLSVDGDKCVGCKRRYFKYWLRWAYGGR